MMRNQALLSALNICAKTEFTLMKHLSKTFASSKIKAKNEKLPYERKHPKHWLLKKYRTIWQIAIWVKFQKLLTIYCSAHYMYYSLYKTLHYIYINISHYIYAESAGRYWLQRGFCTTKSKIISPNCVSLTTYLTLMVKTRQINSAISCFISSLFQLWKWSLSVVIGDPCHRILLEYIKQIFIFAFQWRHHVRSTTSDLFAELAKCITYFWGHSPNGYVRGVVFKLHSSQIIKPSHALMSVAIIFLRIQGLTSTLFRHVMAKRVLEYFDILKNVLVRGILGYCKWHSGWESLV